MTASHCAGARLEAGVDPRKLESWRGLGGTGVSRRCEPGLGAFGQQNVVRVNLCLYCSDVCLWLLSCRDSLDLTSLDIPVIACQFAFLEQLLEG